MKLQSTILVLALLVLPSMGQVRNQFRVNTLGLGLASDNSQEGLSCATVGNRWVIVWPEQLGVNEGRQDIYCAVSDDDGLSFGPMVRVDLGDGPNATDSDEPSVQILADGTIAVLWEEKRAAFASFSSNEDLYFNRSVDGGITWSPQSIPLNVLSAGSHISSDVDFPQLAASGNSLYVTWSEEVIGGVGQAKEIYFTKSDDSGSTWTSPIVLNTQVPGHSNGFWIKNNADNPRIAVEGSRIAVVYVDDRININGLNQNDIWLSLSQDGGTTWTERLVESDVTGTALEPQVSVDGQLVAVCWQDGTPSELASRTIHAAVSLDAGATFSAERLISTLTAPVLGATAFTNSIATTGSDVYISYVTDAVSVGGGGVGGQGGAVPHIAVSNDSGVTFATDIPIDPTATRGNRTKVCAHGETACVHFERGVDGSNRVAYAWTNDRGATWSAAQVANSGPDTDTENTFNGPWFRFNATTGVGLSVYWDRPLGRNEVYAAAIRLPFVESAGLARFGTTANAMLGSATTLGLSGVPVTVAPASVYQLAVSISGSTPPAQVGSLQIHLVPDPLTLALLAEPALAPFLSGGFAANGAGLGLPFPWPFPAGSPDVTVVGVVFGPSGLTYVTDPFWISTP